MKEHLLKKEIWKR